MSGNGESPGTADVCGRHDADIANLQENVQIQGSHLREHDARIDAQDGVLGQVLAALGEARVGFEKARDASMHTLTRVQEMALEWRREFTMLAGRIAVLEAEDDSAPRNLPSLGEFDFGPDTSINIRAGDPVWFARKLDAEREKTHAVETRLAAATAALETRSRISDRAVSELQAETATELERMRLQNARLKVIAGVAATLLGAIVAIATAYLAGKG